MNNNVQGINSDFDSTIKDALHIASDDLEKALALVSIVFEGCNMPWTEQCVKETVMRWAILANTEGEKENG